MSKNAYIISWIVIAVLLITDLILSKRQAKTGDTFYYSKIFQTVLDLSTKIFHGKGVSAAVITEEQGYWSGTSGISEPGKPVGPDMLFNIASIGKNFLAVLTVQLAEEGKLSLDDPISKWGLGSSNINENITIRQLLNHTSGIFDWVTHRESPFIIPYRDIDTSRVWSQNEVINELSGRPYFSPGNGWHYSTTNYNLLKIIIEKVTGNSISIEIQNRFLQPLGLEQVVYLDADGQIPPQLEIVHSWLDIDGDGELNDISGDSQTWIKSMSPHMMYASALDLARWSQALYGGQLLSKASLDQILDFHRPTPDEPPVTGYGLGTEEVSIQNIMQLYGHLGLHYGTMSAMLFFPRYRTSIVVLTNENNPPFQYGVSFGLLGIILLRQLRYFICLAILVILSVIRFAV